MSDQATHLVTMPEDKKRFLLKQLLMLKENTVDATTPTDEISGNHLLMNQTQLFELLNIEH